MTRRRFFFQAEDGIRDRTVTGVQTCALPISGVAIQDVLTGAASEYVTGGAAREAIVAVLTREAVVRLVAVQVVRSEERRVGKEGGPRGVRHVENEKCVLSQ